FAEDLPTDLKAMASGMSLVLDAELLAFRAAASELTDPTDLQRLYARLFLSPPTPVKINTSVYLDGVLMGDSERELRASYDRHGFSRHNEVRDLKDTLWLQLEFIAFLYEKVADLFRCGDHLTLRACQLEADEFITNGPARWITPFLDELEQAVIKNALNPVYLHLGRMLWLAVESSIVAPSPVIARDTHSLLPQGSARGIGALTAEDLAEIAFRLEQDGLAWDHVAANDHWDDAVFAARRSGSLGERT
ncbi:MAG: molecular chaperone, partial [Chromatocurvus sp.]